MTRVTAPASATAPSSPSPREIVSRHTRTHRGKSICFIPHASSDQLLVLLSPHNQGNRFCWIKALVPDPPLNLLYLNNPEDNFYLDDDGGRTYEAIISDFCEPFGPAKTTVMGSSMSASAALRMGVRLGLNVFVAGPQISAAVSKEFAIKSFPNHPKTKLVADIESLERKNQWIEMHEFIKEFDGPLPPIYLLFHHLRFDTRNAYLLIQALQVKVGAKFVVHHTDKTIHGLNLFNHEEIMRAVETLQLLRRIHLNA